MANLIRGLLIFVMLASFYLLMGDIIKEWFKRMRMKNVYRGSTFKEWRDRLLMGNDHRWFYYENSGQHRRLGLGLIVIIVILLLSAGA